MLRDVYEASITARPSRLIIPLNPEDDDDDCDDGPGREGFIPEREIRRNRAAAWNAALLKGTYKRYQYVRRRVVSDVTGWASTEREPGGVECPEARRIWDSVGRRILRKSQRNQLDGTFLYLRQSVLTARATFQLTLSGCPLYHLRHPSFSLCTGCTENYDTVRKGTILCREI